MNPPEEIVSNVAKLERHAAPEETTGPGTNILPVPDITTQTLDEFCSRAAAGHRENRRPPVLESHGYIIGKTIGSGSYATVKVAQSEKHECRVAVKIISKFQAPSDYLKKFLPREIDVVKGLKHPNLIRFLQAIETTHRVYIVMEYAENGSLLDAIKKNSYIDETRARRWFTQLVNAVEYCHDKGVVHRDIKCENLLMDTGYNIKLSDFGFARGQMKAKNGIAQLSRTFCGSYAYASPEILHGVPYEPQLSDIWSMGVVLYATVYGRLPFDDTNYKQLLKQVQSKLVFPKEPKVSAGCKSLITKILVPARSRILIPAIRSDPWMQKTTNEPQSSSTDYTEHTLPGTSSATNISNAEEAIVDLITKDTFKRDSSANKHSGNTTDEEIPTDVLSAPSKSSLSEEADILHGEYNDL